MSLIDELKSGPFTLSLSAGYFGFFSHLGILKLLEEENLLPERIVAASAGAITGGMWATGVKSQEMLKIFMGLKTSDFLDPALGLGVNKGDKFERLAERFVPQKFSETKIPFQVTAVEIPAFRTRVLDKGPIAPAIRASASLPWLFHPAYRERKYFIDGGVFDKTGLYERRHKKERVLFHYLRSGGLWGKLEELRDRKVFKPQDILVLGESTIKVGPGRFHLGPEEFRQSYERARAKLYSSRQQE